MDEIEMGTEIYLEPEGEKIKNAKEIAQASKNAEKYIFCIKYEATEKSVVLSEIKRLECEILEQSDSKGYIMIEASMAQLAAIKTLNCIEKVEIADTNATQKNSLNKTEEYDIMSVKTVDDPEVVLAQTNEAVSANDEISLMCYDDCDNDCDNSNTMQTAISLPIGVWKNGCICCPGAEVWYKFTANISNASEYIIYSSGLTDVVAELYDSCGMYIARGDDEEGYPNFNITRELTYGCTYYVKVYAYGSNTGEYNVRINYNTVSSGGSDDCDSDCSNNQASAIQLNLNTWQNGCICCYGAEAWYKFTPATTAYYTIYTLGSLDTTGSIYDADCNWLNGSDDEGFGNNFKIVHRLLANHTYYIKVMAFGSDTGNYEIVVTNKVFVDSVTVNEEVVILDKGKTQTLSATILPEYATNKALYWESDNTDVVTVNSSTGKITAIDGGKACVCAYAQDGSGKSSCCEVFVTVPVESVIMDASTRVMRVGEESQFTATVCPENADLKALSWESTHPEYATVDYDGLVTAVGVGNTVIKAISKDNESKYGECAVEVKPPIRVQSITMCEEAYTMNVGETTSLSYTIYPDDATNQKVSWYSSNPEVAFVQYYTGEITALKAGTTTITATTDDGSFVASCNVSANQVLTYPDNLISNTSTRNAILKLKNIRDEAVVAYLNGVISCDAMEKAIQKIDYEINLARADYIAVGTNPFSDYAYAILGGDKSAAIPYPFKRNLYYRSSNPFNGLDVMVVQRVLELYGYYEHDSDSLYGTWDQATQDAALNWLPLLSVVSGERVFDNASFYVLFQANNVSQRTYEAMRLLQQFNLQHKQVQIECRNSLVLGGTVARIEMPIKGGSITGRTGRADVVGKTIGGTYVWEVKHNSASAITAGDAQVQRYIAASQTVPEQDAFYPKKLDSLYELPLIAGPSIFAPTAIPWFGKYLLYKSYVSLNPYSNALVVYEESDTIPDGYVYVEEPVAVEVPEPEASYAFNFTGVYNTLTNFGDAIVRGMQIDPQTGEILVTVFVAGTICLLSLAAFATLAVA